MANIEALVAKDNLLRSDMYICYACSEETIAPIVHMRDENCYEDPMHFPTYNKFFNVGQLIDLWKYDINQIKESEKGVVQLLKRCETECLILGIRDPDTPKLAGSSFLQYTVNFINQRINITDHVLMHFEVEEWLEQHRAKFGFPRYLLDQYIDGTKMRDRFVSSEILVFAAYLNNLSPGAGVQFMVGRLLKGSEGQEVSEKELQEHWDGIWQEQEK